MNMKKVGLILLMFMPSLLFADSVTVDGINYSCPNGCVITARNGAYTVSDKLGATMTITIE